MRAKYMIGKQNYACDIKQEADNADDAGEHGFGHGPQIRRGGKICHYCQLCWTFVVSDCYARPGGLSQARPAATVGATLGAAATKTAKQRDRLDQKTGPKGAYPRHSGFSEAGHPFLRHLHVAPAWAGLARRHGRNGRGDSPP